MISVGTRVALRTVPHFKGTVVAKPPPEHRYSDKRGGNMWVHWDATIDPNAAVHEHESGLMILKES